MFLELFEYILQRKEGITKVELNNLYNWLYEENFPVTKLCDKYISFLKESNGGGFLNGDREYQWFSSEEVKDFYYSYKFNIFMPFAFPFALDGNGSFYLFNLRRLDNKVYTVSASNMGWDEEECYILAESFCEMLEQKTRIDEIFI